MAGEEKQQGAGVEGEYTQEGDVNPSVRSRVAVCVCARWAAVC